MSRARRYAYERAAELIRSDLAGSSIAESQYGSELGKIAAAMESAVAAMLETEEAMNGHVESSGEVQEDASER